MFALDYTTAMAALHFIARCLPIVFVIGAGCSSIDPGRCRPDERQAISDSLYCGTAKADGTAVTEEEWERFVAEQVTPRFPRGLTSWRATGQWMSENGSLQREQSYVLYLVHAGTDRENRLVQEIITKYRFTFNQEAVLRVRSPVCTSL